MKQCDGCRANIPLEARKGLGPGVKVHRMGKKYPDFMPYQKDKYKTEEGKSK